MNGDPPSQLLPPVSPGVGLVSHNKRIMCLSEMMCSSEMYYFVDYISARGLEVGVEEINKNVSDVGVATGNDWHKTD